MIFAVTLPVLIGAVGAAVDYGRATTYRSKLQTRLDGAVLAGVVGITDAAAASGKIGNGTDEEKIAIAESFMETGGSDGVSYSFQISGEEMTGEAEATLPTVLLGIIGIEAIPLQARSAATTAAVRAPLCFMAMHPTRKHTLELKQTVSVIAPDCHIYGNSSHFDDVVDPHTPQNHLVGASVQAIGYGHHYIENVSPPLEHAPELIPDPLSALPMPSVGACDHTGFSGEGDMTLSPGTYCDGLELSDGTVELEPGLYVITESAFSLTDVTLQGEGVTIYLADKKAEIDWLRAKVKLKAPKSGAYQSIALLGARVLADHTLEASVVDVEGIIYVLNGTFEWINDGTPPIEAKWTAWIIDGVTWRGSGEIYINFKPEESDIPYPDDLKVIPRPSDARLVM